MPDEAKPAPASKRAKASQDKALANRINTYRNSLTAAQNHAEIPALLQPRGYDAAELANGIRLCDDAQAAFTARADAWTAQGQAASASEAADAAARQGFSDFRKIARKVFASNDNAQSNLGVKGRVPTDLDLFIVMASQAYESALSHSTYLAALSRRGYNQAGLEAEQAKLQAANAAFQAHETAQAAAVHATALRDQAAKAMDDWWSEFRVVAQVALKDRPDLSALLGL